MGKVNKLLKQPLLQFFLIGLTIYLADSFFNQNEDEESNVVIVTSGEIRWLEDNWLKRWNRPPTPEEKKGIVDQLVREKVLYKAALEMGLDKDDVIIRRRMVQKIEFLTSDIITPPSPKADELAGFFEENLSKYKAPDAITITQLYFDPDKREESTLEDAKRALTKLKLQGEPQPGNTGYGDTFMLQDYYPNRSQSELAKLFGSEFAESVFALQPGTWNGPVLSGYGTHLVYVHSLDKSDPPAFADIVDLVQQDWEEMKLQELNEKFIEGLMSRYEIVIEQEGNEESDG